MRKCRSRQWSASCAWPSHWSAMPTPPVKATVPSTTSSLRWVRLLRRPTLYHLSGRYCWMSTPASHARQVVLIAMPAVQHHVDLARHARLGGASANWVPMSPDPVDVGRGDGALHAADRPSIAGKIVAVRGRSLRSAPWMMPGPETLTPISQRNLRVVGRVAISILRSSDFSSVLNLAAGDDQQRRQDGDDRPGRTLTAPACGHRGRSREGRPHCGRSPFSVA